MSGGKYKNGTKRMSVAGIPFLQHKPVTIENSDGEDLLVKLETKTLTKEAQTLTQAEKNQVLDNLGIDPTGAAGTVRYDAAQTLTDVQKQQAKDNIGAAYDEALAEKANIDGYYSQLTAGAAENIVGGNETSREFTRDTAGGTADIADGIVQIDRIKGNTIVWNQLVKNPSFSNNHQDWTLSSVSLTDYDDYVVLQPTTQSYNYNRLEQNCNLKSGHKCLIDFVYKVERINSADYIMDFIGNAVGSPSTILYNTDYIHFSCIRTLNSAYFRLYFSTTQQFGDIKLFIKKDSIRVIDLTKMFGAGNEPATVAEFEKMFPLDYYDYNAGQLLSLNPTGILTDGFNQYNHANPVIKVFPQQYYIGGTYTSIWFSKNADDEEGTEITPVDHIFTPSEYGYIHVEGGNATDTVVNLHWSGKRDGEYEPYWSSTRNIDIASIKDGEGNTLFPDGLCSVGSVNDEVTSTKAIKRIGKQTITGAIGDAITLTGCKATATEYKSISDYGTLANGVLTLTAAVTAQDVYFELATPIEVTFAEPLNLTYRVSDYGTETLLPQNGAVPTTAPIKMEVIYGLNVVDFVRNADKNFVTIEDSTSGDGSTFTNLRSALSTTFGVDIVPTYDSTNKRYTFAITDNRKVEVPASATASGLKGTWAEDETAVYFCTDTNVWVKINKETW